MSEWHYSKNGQQLGPVTASQFQELISTGQISPSDLVWKDGMAEWTPAGAMSGLFDAAPDASGGNPERQVTQSP